MNTTHRKNTAEGGTFSMTCRKWFTRSVACAALTMMAVLFAAGSAQAADGNWKVNALGNWSTASNWSSDPTVPGTTAGDTIGLNNDINAARTVTIDTTSRTNGTLNIGDSNNSHAFTLAASGSAKLTFNNSGSDAALNEVGSVADTISAPLIRAADPRR